MSIKSINAEQLKNKLDSGEKVTVIDCREQNEWDSGHIEAAQFIPLSDFESQFSKLSEKEAELILQCRSGKRSLKACQFLAEQGYTNLTNLEGGILAWIENGYEVKET